MTIKEVDNFEKQLAKLIETLNNLGPIQNWNERYEELKTLHDKLKFLASSFGTSSILGANILNVGNVNQTTIENRCIVLEAFIGELINNIHNSLQTKMMLSACVFAKRSCFWAAVAAIVACISVGIMCLN